VLAELYIVGVDGGATKTVALIGTGTRILGRGRSSSSNYHNVGTVQAAKAIRSAVASAKRQCGVPIGRIGTAVVALAGIDSTAGVGIARRIVREANVARKSFVIHDSVSALYAATKGKPGIIVNSGTGSFATGINPAGEYIRIGGWGYLIDDKGSAFDIGMKAISMGFRMMDGRTPRTGLVRLLKARFNVKRFDIILDRVYSGRIDVEEIAALAPYISNAADHDRVCRQILKEAGTALADLACTAARRLKMTRSLFPLIMTGGGFKSGRPFTDSFKAKVRHECPHASFHAIEEEPVMGAYLMAAKLRQGQRKLSRGDRWIRHVAH